MKQENLTAMVGSGRDFLQIIRSVPEDKRFLLSMVMDAFVSGMTAREHLDSLDNDRDEQGQGKYTA